MMTFQSWVGKNASLGEMISELKDNGIRVPDGFATVAEAYWDFLEANDLKDKIGTHLQKLQYNKMRDPLQTRLKELRETLGKLKEASEDDWSDLKSNIDKALKRFQKSFDGLVSSMNDYLSLGDVEGGMKMQNSEIMTKNPKVCMPVDKVGVPVEIMWDYDCGDVPVVKDMDSRELVGMVTDRDIAISVVKHINAHPSKVTVEDCMSSPVISCHQDEPVETTIQLMNKHRIRRIPVVDGDGACIGIISQADLLRDKSNEEAVMDMLYSISAPRS